MSTSNILRFIRRSSCVVNRKNRDIFNSTQQLKLSKMSAKESQNEKTKETFQDALPSVLNTLTAHKHIKSLPEVESWIKKVLEYNLAGGKKARGLTTLFAYEMLEKPENITEESLHLAKIMGWCVEMLQAHLVVQDDIMDGSSSRRGLLCWYRLPEVGLGAINDAVLIYSSIFYVLKTHFRDHKYYVDMNELFNESLLKTSIGQHLDVTMERRHKSDYSLFTIERYNAIVTYKTAYYTYQLPVCLGMLLANIADPALHKKAEDLCIKIGRFFQIQDDYIDCYGDESISGKAGTDIQEAKCSWLAVMALQRCTPAQKVVFTTCYGSQEPAHIERIKELYRQLQLPQLYAEEETRMYESLVRQANELPRELSPQLFIKLVNMIYKRCR